MGTTILSNVKGHFGLTDLVSKIQKSGSGDNNFVKCKGTFWSD